MLTDVRLLILFQFRFVLPLAYGQVAGGADRIKRNVTILAMHECRDDHDHLPVRGDTKPFGCLAPFLRGFD